MTEPSFWDKWEWARAHQKPESKLIVDNSRASRAPMTVVPSAPVPNLGPSINDASVRPPSDSFLEFDPNGPGERLTGLLNLRTVREAKRLGEEARAVTMRDYPDDPGKPGRRTNDEADAFRHSYWNYRMTQAFGPDRARAFANGHEISVPNPIGERRMDLYNNQVGRELAASGAPVEEIKRAIGRGVTRNRPF